MVAQELIERIGIKDEAVVVLCSDHDAAIVVVAEAIELLWVADGKPLEHDGVDQSEDRGVRADAECEREDDDGAECRGFAEGTKREANVAPEILDERFPGGGADFFFRDFDGA